MSSMFLAALTTSSLGSCLINLPDSESNTDIIGLFRTSSTENRSERELSGKDAFSFSTSAIRSSTDRASSATWAASESTSEAFLADTSGSSFLIAFDVGVLSTGVAVEVFLTSDALTAPSITPDAAGAFVFSATILRLLPNQSLVNNR